MKSLLFIENYHVSWGLSMFISTIIMQGNYKMFLSYNYKPVFPIFEVKSFQNHTEEYVASKIQGHSQNSHSKPRDMNQMTFAVPCCDLRLWGTTSQWRQSTQDDSYFSRKPPGRKQLWNEVRGKGGYACVLQERLLWSGFSWYVSVKTLSLEYRAGW